MNGHHHQECFKVKDNSIITLPITTKKIAITTTTLRTTPNKK